MNLESGRSKKVDKPTFQDLLNVTPQIVLRSGDAKLHRSIATLLHAFAGNVVSGKEMTSI